MIDVVNNLERNKNQLDVIMVGKKCRRQPDSEDSFEPIAQIYKDAPQLFPKFSVSKTLKITKIKWKMGTILERGNILKR